MRSTIDSQVRKLNEHELVRRRMDELLGQIDTLKERITLLTDSNNSPQCMACTLYERGITRGNDKLKVKARTMKHTCPEWG